MTTKDCSQPSGAMSSHQKPALDSSVIDSLMELETATQTVGFMVMLVNSFLKSLPERIENLQSAFTQGNTEDMHRIAHTLKGSAGNMGAMCLSNISGEFDVTLRQGTSSELREKYDQLQREILRAQRAFEALKLDLLAKAT